MHLSNSLGKKCFFVESLLGSDVARDVFARPWILFFVASEYTRVLVRCRPLWNCFKEAWSKQHFWCAATLRNTPTRAITEDHVPYFGAPAVFVLREWVQWTRTISSEMVGKGTHSSVNLCNIDHDLSRVQDLSKALCNWILHQPVSSDLECHCFWKRLRSRWFKKFKVYN